MDYGDAVATLFQAPHNTFVAERKRLAGELKADGKAADATRLSGLARPPISAWAVNQLWWHEQSAFEALIGSAERVRKGERAGMNDHRDALATLRSRAAELLRDSGHAAAEATLRRVTATLAALAAAGGFQPDEVGALTADRDPPGFGEAGLMATAPEPRAEAGKKAKKANEDEQDREREQRVAARKREEEQRAKHEAERKRLRVALREAREDAKKHVDEIDRLRRAITREEKQHERAHAEIEKLEAQIAEIEQRLRE